MPNWCNTRYCFYIDKPEHHSQLLQLYECISIGISKDNPVAKPNGFGDDWLGNVLAYATKDMHIPLNTSNKPAYLSRSGEEIPYRGNITDIDPFDETLPEGFSYFFVGSETAWGPMPEMWQYILDCLHLVGVKFVYIAEEPGGGVYINTDIDGQFFPEKWYLDYCLPAKVGYDYGEDYFDNDDEDALLSTLNSLIADIRGICLEQDATELVPQATIEAAVGLIQEQIAHDDDAYLYLHEYINI